LKVSDDHNKKNESDQQGDRTFWQNFIRKFHFEVKIQTLSISITNENPTRKTAGFTFNLRDLLFTKERPSSEIIDYHFRLATSEIEGTMRLNETTRYRVLCIRSLHATPFGFTEKGTHNQAVHIDLKILRQLKSSLSSQIDNKIRKLSNLSEEIEKKLIIRAHISSIQTMLSPLVCIYLKRLLVKLDRASYHSSLVAALNRAEANQKQSNKQSNKNHDLNDLHKLTSTFIMTMENLSSKMAKCEAATANFQDIEEPTLSKAISQNLLQSESDNQNDSFSDENQDVSKLVIDIESHLEAFVMGYLIDTIESPPVFSWIEIENLKNDGNKEPILKSSLRFGDLIFDHYLAIFTNLHLKHQSSHSKSMILSLKSAEVIRLEPIKDMVLSRNESMENQIKNVIQEGFGFSSRVTLSPSNNHKVHEEYNSVYEDKFYSVIEDSAFHSVKDKNMWDEWVLIKFGEKVEDEIPCLRVEFETNSSETSTVSFSFQNLINLNLNTSTFPLKLLLNGWSFASYQVQRALQFEDLSPKKGAIIEEERQNLYHGLQEDQLKEFFFNPLIGMLSNTQKVKDISSSIIQESALINIHLKVFFNKLLINLKGDTSENSSLVTDVTGLSLEWNGTKKNVQMKVSNYINSYIKQEENSSLHQSDLQLFHYKASKQDRISVCNNLGTYQIFMSDIKATASLNRLTQLAPLVSTWSSWLAEVSNPELPCLSTLLSSFDKVNNHFAEESKVYTDLETALNSQISENTITEVMASIRSFTLTFEDESGRLHRQFFMSKTQSISDDFDEWSIPQAGGFVSLKDDIQSKNKYWLTKQAEDKTIMILQLDDLFLMKNKDEPNSVLMSIFTGKLQDGFTNLVVDRGNLKGEVEIFYFSNYLFKGKESPTRKLNFDNEDPNLLSAAFYEIWQSSTMMNTFVTMKYDMKTNDTAIIVSPCLLKQKATSFSLLDSMIQQLWSFVSHKVLLGGPNSAKPANPASRQSVKLTFQQTFLDMVDLDGCRFLAKIAGLSFKVDSRQGKIKAEIDLRQLKIFGATGLEGNLQINCYQGLDSNDKFFGIASFNNMLATIIHLNDCEELEIDIKVPIRDEKESQGPQVWISPAAITVILRMKEYIDRLSNLVNDLTRVKQPEKKAPYMASKFEEAKKSNQGSVALNKYFQQLKDNDDSFEKLGTNITTIETIIECLTCKALDSAEGIIRDTEKPYSEENIKEGDKLRLSLHISKLQLFIFCQNSFDQERNLELRVSDLTLILRQDGLTSSSGATVGSQHTTLLSIGSLSIIDNIACSIFQFVLESGQSPLTLAAYHCLLDADRDSPPQLAKSATPRRKTSEAADKHGSLAVLPPVSRQRSHDAIELALDFGKLPVRRLRSLDDTVGLRLVLQVKPLNIFLTESSCELLIEFCRGVQASLGATTPETGELPAQPESSARPSVSVDYIYVSEVELTCRSSSKSMLAPVKYLPSLDLVLSMLLIEDEQLLPEAHFWAKVQKHYLGELKLRQLIKSNFKNVAVIGQLLKVGHALVSIYQYIKYQDREVSPYLHVLKDFILWNLFKAGEFGISIIGDIIGAFGKLQSELGYHNLRRNRYFDNLEKKLYLLESGNMDFLKS
jgi:hypothetical protein